MGGCGWPSAGPLQTPARRRVAGSTVCPCLPQRLCGTRKNDSAETRAQTPTKRNHAVAPSHPETVSRRTPATCFSERGTHPGLSGELWTGSEGRSLRGPGWEAAQPCLHEMGQPWSAEHRAVSGKQVASSGLTEGRWRVTPMSPLADSLSINRDQGGCVT